jgi:TfoX/Sxy family transcriptional regulator of competence genes
MAYDEELADRVRAALAGRSDDISERRMFGGLAFMAGGHMACGVIGEDLVVRLGEDGADAALDEPGTRPMDFTGRPMKGYVYVEPSATATGEAIGAWTRRALAFVATLPPR